MLQTDCSVSKIGHVFFAENVCGVLFLMFGFGNLMWDEKMFAHLFHILLCWRVYQCLVLGLIMGGD
jgi:hypothetical protein